MKKLIAAALCVMGVAAYAAKFEWKLEPDRLDGRYKSGETVKYTFSGKLDGQPIPESDYFDCVNFAHRLHGKSIVTEACRRHDGVWAYGVRHELIGKILKDLRK